MNYSLIEIDLQLLKLISYPLYLLLMTIFSALIMFKVKRLDSTTIKISLGLFFSVVIYYINNFFCYGYQKYQPYQLYLYH